MIKRLLVVVIPAIAFLFLMLWALGSKGGVRYRIAANEHYDKAVAAYMFGDVGGAHTLFAEVARDYPDLSISPLAELKQAFLVYDEDKDVDRAKALFNKFLEDHPATIIHLPDWPREGHEYYGELQLVAYFFLGRIAHDRSDLSEARRWYEHIIETGSRNPANYIVAQCRSFLDSIDRLKKMGDRVDD